MNTKLLIVLTLFLLALPSVNAYCFLGIGDCAPEIILINRGSNEDVNYSWIDTMEFAFERPAKNIDVEVIGANLIISSSSSINSGAPINISTGISKLKLEVLSGTDTIGDITINAVKHDRDTGVTTEPFSEILALNGVGDTNMTIEWIGNKTSSNDINLTTTNFDGVLELTQWSFYQNLQDDFNILRVSVTIETADTADAKSFDFNFFKVASDGEVVALVSFNDIDFAPNGIVRDRIYRLDRRCIASECFINGAIDGIHAAFDQINIETVEIIITYEFTKKLQVSGVAGNNVTRLLAGSNISLSPSTGIGDVTVNATGLGNVYTDTNVFTLLEGQVPWTDANVSNGITLTNLTQIITRSYTVLQNLPFIPSTGAWDSNYFVNVWNSDFNSNWLDLFTGQNISLLNNDSGYITTQIADTNAQTGCTANQLLAGVNGCTSSPTITGTNFSSIPDGALEESYLLADGFRALVGAWDMGNQVLTNVNIDSGSVPASVITAGTFGGSTAYAFPSSLSVNGTLGTTGNITITKTTAMLNLVGSTGNTSLSISGDAGSNQNLYFKSAGVFRWIIKSDSTSESGSNVGSNFQLMSREDDGTALRTNIFIDRVSGDFSIVGDTDITGNLEVTENVGIGTPAPADNLHIKSLTAGIIIEGTTSNDFGAANLEFVSEAVTPTTLQQNILFGDATDNDVGRIVYQHRASSANTDFMAFYTNAAERLRIGNNGLVTLTGNLLVNGGNIGITADTDLLGLASNALTVNGSLDVVGRLSINKRSVLTVNSGEISAIDASFVDLTPETGSSDDLVTIRDGADGQILILRTQLSTADVTLKDGTGNLQLNGDFTLATARDTIMLIHTVNDWWLEISRSSNG